MLSEIIKVVKRRQDFVRIRCKVSPSTHFLNVCLELMKVQTFLLLFFFFSFLIKCLQTVHRFSQFDKLSVLQSVNDRLCLIYISNALCSREIERGKSLTLSKNDHNILVSSHLVFLLYELVNVATKLKGLCCSSHETFLFDFLFYIVTPHFEKMCSVY